MNKKFSTLVASLLLASAVGTATAADQGVRSAFPGDRPYAIENGKYYQLTKDNQVLVMSQNPDGTYVLKFVNYAQAELSKSLWEIKPVKMNDENGIAFQFYNLSCGLPISFDIADAAKTNATATAAATLLSKEAMKWKWAQGVKGVGIAGTYNMEAYFGIDNDSIMTLQNAANGSVVAVKYATEGTALSSLALGVREAGAVTLTDYDLNSMLQTQDVRELLKLTFTKDVTDPSAGNLFTSQKYQAVAPLTNTFSIATVKELKDEADTKYVVYQNAEKALAELREQIAVGNPALTAANEKLTALTAAAVALTTTRDEAYANYLTAKAAYDVLKKAEGEAAHNLQDLEGIEAEVQVRYNAAMADKDVADAAVEANTATILALGNAKTTAETAATNAATAAATAATAATKATDDETAVSAAVAYIKNFNGAASAVKGAYATEASYSGLTGERKKLVDDLLDKIATYTSAICNTTPAIATTADEYQAPISEAKTDADDTKTAADTAKNEADQDLVDATADLATEEGKTAGLEATQATAQDAFDLVAAELGTASGEAAAAVEALTAATEAATAKWNEVTSEQTTYTEASIALAAKQKEVAAQQVIFDGLIEDRGDLYAQINEAGAEVRNTLADYNRAYDLYLNHNGMQDNWYSLKASNGNFLMVDTGYVTKESGRKDLGFAVRTRGEMTAATAGNIYNARDINGRFNFRFTYFPTSDSIAIVSDGFNKKFETTTYWKNRGANEINPYASAIRGQEPNLVKIAVLGGGRREVTVGNSENLLGTDIYTINTRIGLGLVPENTDIVLAAGLYHVKIKNAADAEKDGAYLIYDLDRSLTKIKPDSNVDFAHMPSTQWAVEATNIYGASPTAYNREYGVSLTTRSYETLAKDKIVTTYFYNNQIVKDTLVFVPVANDTLGYYNEKPAINQLHKIDYLHMAEGYQVSVGSTIMGNDTILNVVSGFKGANFDLIPVALNMPYGLKDFGSVKNLVRGKYILRVNDGNKLVNNGKYVSFSSVNGTEMMTVTEDAEKAAPFFLKEVNCVDGVHYYAIILVNGDNTPIFKAGVNESLGLMKAEDIKSETRTSAFKLAIDDTKLYREFTAEELANDGILNFYRVNSTDKEYLYEDTDSKYSAGKGIPFLGVEGKGDAKDADMTVIPTGVTKTLMPQYLIARGVSTVKGDTVWCNATEGHKHLTLADSLACPHTIITKDTIKGRFLINLIDSVSVDSKYTWENKYKRLAFVPGIITEDKLIITSSKKEIPLSTVNKHDATKFEFRLIDDNTDNFLIESESWAGNNAFAGAIAPFEKGGWVKIQNGVPVIVNGSWEDAQQAEVFNITASSATSNDVITTSAISVVAGDGNVQIAGAQGKKVVISNVLGQVIANSVITSDNATIAVPAGVVVVAVEGEAAVKAIVK